MILVRRSLGASFCLIGVNYRQSVACAHIAGLDGGDHVVMFGDVFLGQAILGRKIVKPEKSALVIQKPREHRGAIFVAPGLGDGGVEIAVGRNHRQRILALEGFGKAGLMAAYDQQATGLVQFGRFAGGDAVHQFEAVENAVQVQKIDLKHHGRAVGLRADQPFARQPDQRFAGGVRRDLLAR